MADSSPRRKVTWPRNKGIEPTTRTGDCRCLSDRPLNEKDLAAGADPRKRRHWAACGGVGVAHYWLCLLQATSPRRTGEKGPSCDTGPPMNDRDPGPRRTLM
ncbi:hypothetical protein IscW_ISCW013994 [Ixodes scapularis]|uniref:Uncharacterized protein n=1 Tax=Ixodes scapularis TaxID=6945 RepID=B7QJ56_IXOSC|nr:hypothetical protein IscW_ISCW013994 [Ixodes scapularis]|eukprot:XP_002415213.1 hypothetical protein IscW_ISCW013994 [Ixodes scapularis]